MTSAEGALGEGNIGRALQSSASPGSRSPALADLITLLALKKNRPTRRLNKYFRSAVLSFGADCNQQNNPGGISVFYQTPLGNMHMATTKERYHQPEGSFTSSRECGDLHCFP